MSPRSQVAAHHSRPLLAVWLEPLAAASLLALAALAGLAADLSLEPAVPEALAAVAEHIARSSCYQVWAAAAAELPLEPAAADHLKEHSCLVVPVLATEPEAVAAHHCSATAERAARPPTLAQRQLLGMVVALAGTGQTMPQRSPEQTASC